MLNHRESTVFTMIAAILVILALLFAGVGIAGLLFDPLHPLKGILSKIISQLAIVCVYGSVSCILLAQSWLVGVSVTASAGAQVKLRRQKTAAVGIFTMLFLITTAVFGFAAVNFFAVVLVGGVTYFWLVIVERMRLTTITQKKT